MSWTDLTFLVFIIPLMLILLIRQYFNGKLWIRNVVLLIASYWFYYNLSSTFIVLLILVTGINYIGGKQLLKNRKKLTCSIIVILSLIPLVFFKYANFICTDILGLEQNNLGNLALPIGISFFTFQALTYTIDIYRGKISKSATLLDYALFVCFFPTIMSGPIEKARNMLKQISGESPITLIGLVGGSQIFIWGLFKKIVVADRISDYVDIFYYSPDGYSGNSYLLAIILYSLQIYCDFSGYSDMSIGVAKILGFKLGENFRFPYFSTTVGQFWKKWHISLTSWFTEYLYISCGGNRVKKWRWIINISLVFIISGLWHGAAWTFIIWGACHAILYLFEHFIKLKSSELRLPRKYLQAFYVYMVVSIAWVFFRADSFHKALDIIGGITHPWGNFYFGSSLMSFAIMTLVTLLFVIFEILVFTRYVNIYNEEKSYLWRNQLFSLSLMLIICLLGQSGASFVYSQF